MAGLTIGQSETEPLPSPMFEKILVEVNGEGLDPYALAINGPSRWPVYCQRLLLRQSPPKSHSGAAKRKQKVALQNRSERIDLTEFKYCATKLDLPIGRENRIRFRVKISVGWMLSHLLIGSCVYMGLEGTTFIDSFYFCFVTLTTIGLGDFVPSTVGGIIFQFIFCSMGLGLVGAVISASTEYGGVMASNAHEYENKAIELLTLHINAESATRDHTVEGGWRRESINVDGWGGAVRLQGKDTIQRLIELLAVRLIEPAEAERQFILSIEIENVNESIEMERAEGCCGDGLAALADYRILDGSAVFVVVGEKAQGIVGRSNFSSMLGTIGFGNQVGSAPRHTYCERNAARPMRPMPSNSAVAEEAEQGAASPAEIVAAAKQNAAAIKEAALLEAAGARTALLAQAEREADAIRAAVNRATESAAPRASGTPARTSNTTRTPRGLHERLPAVHMCVPRFASQSAYLNIVLTGVNGRRPSEREAGRTACAAMTMAATASTSAQSPPRGESASPGESQCLVVVGTLSTQ